MFSVSMTDFFKLIFINAILSSDAVGNYFIWLYV